MEAQIVEFKNRGMFQDTSISKASNEFAFENKNIRITPVNDDTLFSVTNEKGPLDLSITLQGKFLGKCIFDDSIIIFTISDTFDYIYKIEPSSNNEIASSILFRGHLNFNLDSPIEAVPYYESSSIKKVYWVDGRNLTRVINIAGNQVIQDTGIYTGYDFSPEINSLPNVTVTKEYKGKGQFPAGVIQYFISYYNKYGSGTPLVYASGLNYITRDDRGAKADEICTCSFNLSINNLDYQHFDHIRVYSMIRTSLDGPKEVKIVGDFEIGENALSLTDTNINHQTIPDTDIYFIGGQYFIASTLDFKTDTLFFGNIKLQEGINPDDIRQITDTWYNSNREATYISFDYKTAPCNLETGGVYTWDSQLEDSSEDIKTFKRGEIYRFAIQFLNKTGEWTQAFFIGDKETDKAPYVNNSLYYLPVAQFTRPDNFEQSFSQFTGYRILMADSSYSNRKILAQGIISPTVFSFSDRVRNKTFACSSWMIRPRNLNGVEARHYAPLINEIQSSHYKSLTDAKNADCVPYSPKAQDGDTYKYLIVLFTSQGHYANVFFAKCKYDAARSKNILLNSSPNNYRTAWIDHSNSWDTQIDRLSKEAIDFGITSTSDLFPNSNWMYNSVRDWDIFKKGDAEANGFIYAGRSGSGTSNKNILSYIPSLACQDGATSFMVDGFSNVSYKFIDMQVAGTGTPAQDRAFFIDEQIITLNSPDTEKVADMVSGSNCKMRIVGLAPITANYGDFTLQVENAGLSPSATAITSNKFTQPNGGSEGITPIISPYLWSDFGWDSDAKATSSHFDVYKVYLWHSQSSLSGYSMANDAQIYELAPAKLKHKVFGNEFFSISTKYFDDTKFVDLDNIKASTYLDDGTLKPFSWEGKSKIYGGELDTLVTCGLADVYYPEAKIGGINGADDTVFTNPDIIDKFKLYDSTRIKYKCTPHIITCLGSKTILPRLYDEREWSISGIYNIFDNTGSIQDDTYDMLNFSWYTSVNSANPDFKFAGAYYSEQDSETAIRNLITTKGIQIVDSDFIDNGSYYIGRLETGSDELNTIYVYSDSTGGVYSVRAICPTTGHPAIQLDYDVENLQYGGIEHRTTTITAGNTEEVLLSVAYNEDVYSEVESDWGTVVNGTPPSQDYGPVITTFYKVTRSGNNYTIERQNSAPEGMCVLDTGQYEYYSFNHLSLPAYIEFVPNNTSGWKAHGVTIDRKLATEFTQQALDESISCSSPYLFLGEIYRDATADELYGNILENLSWNPISTVAPISEDIEKTWGDTFYQRWDCLKSYPATEEDVNSIVDITSFMVETHINLDARSDVNRGTQSLLKARPTNFNLFNDVYNQDDNVFQYNVLDESFDTSQFSNQVVWSMPKSPVDAIDSWTDISLANSLYLDGTFGDITKVININDSIVAFQDKAIATILYNDRVQLSTEQGVPIQLANSGKVDGYVYASKANGCHNKWSICSGSSGVYFIDSLTKSFLRFNKEGIQDLSLSGGMSQWFKDNVTEDIWRPLGSGFRVNFDNITKDLYIANSTVCILYNETLGTFTSFMSYEGRPFIFNIRGKSYILDSSTNSKIYQLFGGGYNTTFDDSLMSYSITYRVNPEPFIDKTFTNLEFIADCLDPSKAVGEPLNLTSTIPFSKLKVWNEYQSGEKDLVVGYSPSNLKKKFRIWRVDIPRDSNSRYKLDRIRNPWVNIQLSKINSNTNKMVFHNLLVKYYK